ncbi:hypothetical protein D3C80_448640 [compost metagenome]
MIGENIMKFSLVVYIISLLVIACAALLGLSGLEHTAEAWLKASLGGFVIATFSLILGFFVWALEEIW